MRALCGKKVYQREERKGREGGCSRQNSATPLENYLKKEKREKRETKKQIGFEKVKTNFLTL